MAPPAKRRRTSPALNKAKAQIARYRKKMSVLRKEVKGSTKHGAETVTCAALVSGGGAASGIVELYYPQTFGIDTRLIGGVALVGIGAIQKEGKAGSIMAMLGSGMLACVAADFTMNAIGNINQEVAT